LYYAHWVETIKFQSRKPNPVNLIEISIYLVLLYSLALLVEVLTRPYAYEEIHNKWGNVATMILQKSNPWSQDLQNSFA